MKRSSNRSVATRLRALLLTAGLVLAGVVGVASPASAHDITCGSYNQTPSFACVSSSGYSGQQPWNYKVDDFGHNCTNYVSYRLWQNGVANPGNLGFAHEWNEKAAGYGIPVNNTPAVGSVAVWEINHFPAEGSGHVAYVEAVTSTYIDISEDNFGGTTMRKRFYVGQSDWPDHFIHFKDVVAVPVDTDGDGIVNTSDDCPTQAGPSDTGGCPDADNDSVADASDTCKYFAGAPSNRGCRLDSHTVSGNFIGNDSYTDTISFYQYSNAELGAFVSTGSVDGVGKPQQLWRTGTGQWNWGSSTFLAGNFAGDDSYTDVIGLYDYGNSRLGVFLFQGNGHGVDQGRRLWTTTDGAWKLGNARYVVGNFSGNDGKDDILAFYQYPANDMGTQVFAGNGDGVSQPQAQWRTGPDHWSVSRAEYIAGDFAGDDSYTDVIAFYQYSNSDTGAFLFQGGVGDVGQPQSLWRTGTGQWTVSNAEYFAGDFYGGDDVTDIVALYRLPDATMRAFVFPGGSGVSREQTLWTTAAGQWYVTKTKGIAGKFSGTASSLFAWYDYGSSDTGGHLFAPATAGGVQLPQSKWRTGDGQWSWTHM